VFIELDGQGPAYQQLTRALKEAILDGRLKAGTRLPSTRALAQELGMSRITVLSAYDQLRAEGYLHSRVGSGSYVSELLVAPPAPHPVCSAIATPSRYARRARHHVDRSISRMHRGLRFNMQYGEIAGLHGLNTAWGRELTRAAAYTPLERQLPEGSLALREQICSYLAHRRGIRATPDEVLLVNGAQQAFDLVARVLLDEGDRVVMEEPHYFGAWRAFGAHGADLLPVRTDGEGLACAELPEQAPQLVCVTPSHQFPSGVAMSLPRRLALMQYAESKSCWVLEDDYDSEFRYDSQPLAALRSLDRTERVIYVGTFSKVMFGSMRLGYMLLPRALYQDFVNARYLADTGGMAIEQAAMAHFMESGAFERHLWRTGKVLKQRREALLRGLRQHAGQRVLVDDSQAGLHVVAWLPDYDHAQLNALVRHAHQHGLGLYPIAPCYHGEPPMPGLMLGYGGLPSSELGEAMRLFGCCLDAAHANGFEAA
jgi:GntR family transcriptional regulator/MocR family aminotransferase